MSSFTDEDIQNEINSEIMAEEKRVEIELLIQQDIVKTIKENEQAIERHYHELKMCNDRISYILAEIKQLNNEILYCRKHQDKYYVFTH